MGKDHGQPSPLHFTGAGDPAPSYCGSDTEEPSGAVEVPPQQAEGVILACKEESVPGAS